VRPARCRRGTAPTADRIIPAFGGLVRVAVVGGRPGLAGGAQSRLHAWEERWARDVAAGEEALSAHTARLRRRIEAASDLTAPDVTAPGAGAAAVQAATLTDAVAAGLALDLVVAWLLHSGATGAWARLDDRVRVTAGIARPEPWAAGPAAVDAATGAVATARDDRSAVTVTAPEGWRASVLAAAALDRPGHQRDGLVRSAGGRLVN
jgi:hypothetical protein